MCNLLFPFTDINPLLKNISKRQTPFLRNYYVEGLRNDYFIRVPCATTESYIEKENSCVWRGYGGSAMVDLTNPNAWSWYKNIIIDNMLSTKGYHASPVDGWMADFGESVPLNARLFNSSINQEYLHAIYPELWATVNEEAIAETNRTGDVVFFTRSQSPQSPRSSTLFWLGDQLVTWDGCDGLQTAIIGMLSSAVSGFSLTHSDSKWFLTWCPANNNYTHILPLQLVATQVFTCHHSLSTDDPSNC